MEVSNLLSIDGQQDVHDRSLATNGDLGPSHQYPTRRSLSTNGVADGRLASSIEYGDSHSATRSPSGQGLKNVSFELQLDGSPNIRGRLPMRVQIFPHDTTESIVTTVKNFYGLYDSVSEGVSFEDVERNPLVASFENLANNMTVYVRVAPELAQRPDEAGGWEQRTHSPARMNPLGDGTPMLPPPSAQALGYGQPPSRPGSRVSRRQSASPKISQAKIGSAQKVRSRSGAKSQGSSFQAGLDELNSDIHNGYSSSDGGGAGSVTSSRMARSEQLATAEISVDNIVEGGRRQKAKFESSELPLFVPPQVPAPISISSISPQRPPNPAVNPSPLPRPLQHTLSLQPPGQVIPAFGASEQPASAPPTASPFTIPAVPTHGHRLRDRTSGTAFSARSSLGSANRFYTSNILPTPDPTVASCISDEDVALQLMRLGDVSNFSHGRTSGSTFDDAFSGKADATSSVGSDADSDADDTDGSDQRDFAGPPLKKQRRHTDDGWSGFRYEPTGDNFNPETGRYGSMGKIKAHNVKKARANGLSIKPLKSTKKPKKVSSGDFQQPISPSSLPGQSRKTSTSTINFQHQLQDDEADLSSKPRCQRCRKSKKGCDRQRPCQRCVDAGIGIEGCVSEEEGNGRKGRYGRHMGVSIKREGDSMMADHESEAAGAILTGMSVDPLGADNLKKRKR